MKDKIVLCAAAAMVGLPLVSARGESIVADAWTGGRGESISLPGNWASGATPDLTGLCTATFAAADATGFSLTVDRDVAFAGLRLDAVNGFAFSADESGHVLSIGSGGIVAANPTDGASPLYSFAVPLRVTAEQQWVFPSGTAAAFSGGIVADAPFGKGGNGSLSFNGSNVWDGRVVISNGNISLSGTITTSSGVDTTRLDGSSDSPNAGNAVYAHLGGVAGGSKNYLYVSNAVVEKAFWVDMAKSTSDYYFRANNASTNTFRGYFRSRNRENQKLYVPAGSEVRFEGGAYFPWAFFQGGPGVVRFSKTPITYNATSETGYSVQSSGNAIFEVGTNTIKYLSIKGDGGRFDFSADYVCGLGDQGTLVMNGGLRRTSSHAACGSVLDIHGTRQRLGALKAADKYIDGKFVGLSEISGDSGSLLEITNKVTTRTSTINHVPFVGGISLRFDSPGTMVFTNVTCTATGTVEVAKGTMEFRHGASWLTATNIVVGGRLVLADSEGESNHQTFGRYANWRFTDGGVVSIPAGVEQRAARVWVGDVELPCGVYSYDRIADEAIRAHFDPNASGTLRVMGNGKGIILSIF